MTFVKNRPPIAKKEEGRDVSTQLTPQGPGSYDHYYRI